MTKVTAQARTVKGGKQRWKRGVFRRLRKVDREDADQSREWVTQSDP